MMNNILNCDVSLSTSFPKHFDKESQDLISGLLTSNPVNRLGSLARGLQDIWDHPFFNGFQIGYMEGRAYNTPFKPKSPEISDEERQSPMEFKGRSTDFAKFDMAIRSIT
mmetsp:Transcript_19429/g.26368  ORF Transcript_19429/g.26368 Transcript_19429/m.26368 type:complete len:110 (-) Transcript_19429:140-469(-)